jgi:hypothetical protein
MPGAVVVDLAGDLDWNAFEIPGATIPARIVTLHVDPSRARSLLVEFPEGFRRDVEGWYECAEELVVIEGGLEMSGQTYRPNDWAWIPAGAPRTATAAKPSMLALARFDGPARWHEGSAPSTGPVRRDVLGDRARVLRRGAQESTWLTEPPSGVADSDTELLAIESRTWARVPAGATFPALEGPIFCRTFPAGGTA